MELANPPGLRQIFFRIGDWVSFRAAMLARLRLAEPAGDQEAPLADADLESSSSWITAVIEAWAMVGEILSFYQERIANEGYLGSATESASVSLLYRKVGLPQPPVVSAETALAFTVAPSPFDKNTGAANEVRIAAGTKVRILPLSGKTPPASPTTPLPVPPTFETTESLNADPRCNALKAAVSVEKAGVEIRGDATELRLQGVKTGLSAGEPLLLAGEPKPESALAVYLRYLIAVEAKSPRSYTWLRLDAPLAERSGSPPSVLETLASPRIFGFGRPLRLFGAKARQWKSLAPQKKRLFAPAEGGVRATRLDGSVRFEPCDHGLPLADLTALATTGGALFAATAASRGARCGVYRSADGGASWQRAAANGLILQTVQCLLALGPPGQLLAGGIGGVYQTIDGGESWDPLTGGPPKVELSSPPELIPTSLPRTVVRALASVEGWVIAATDSGIFRFDGSAWQQAADSGGGPMAIASTAFAPTLASGSPLEPLYAATLDEVYRSEDGISWSATVSLPATARPLRALAIAESELFAGGYDGVYRLNLGLPSTSWERLEFGSPSNQPLEISALTVAGNDLYIGTAMQGLWRFRIGSTEGPAFLGLNRQSVLALLAAEKRLFVATPFGGFPSEWPDFHLNGLQVDLGAVDRRIVAGGWVALLQSGGVGSPLAGAYRILSVQEVRRQGFLLDSNITRLHVERGSSLPLSLFDLRTTEVWVGSRELELYCQASSLPTPLQGTEIVLDGLLTASLAPGRRLIVSGQAMNAAVLPLQGVPPFATSESGTQKLDVGSSQLFEALLASTAPASFDQGNLPDDLIQAFLVHRLPLSDKASIHRGPPKNLWWVLDRESVYFLAPTSSGRIAISVPNVILRLLGPPRKGRWPVADRLGFSGWLEASKDQMLLLPARRSDPRSSELARLKRQLPAPGSDASRLETSDRSLTRLELEQSLDGFYDAATVAISGNVVPAVSGQTIDHEVLGSGDPTKPNQTFKTRRLPIDHQVGEAGEVHTTLKVMVSGQSWQEVPSLHQAGPASRVYLAAYDENGNATITFGDGVHGARPAAGRDNVLASYRGSAIGLEPEVPANSLVQLLSGPGHIRQITNPLPAQRLLPASSDLRGPLPGISALGRTVAARDFESLLLALPQVAAARARRLWTGKTFVVGITVLPKGGQKLEPGSSLWRQIEALLHSTPSAPFELTAPRYKYFLLQATLQLPAGTGETVREQTRRVATTTLDANLGTGGNRLGKSVTSGQVLALLYQVPGVQAVLSLSLHGEIPAADLSWDFSAAKVKPAEVLLLASQGGLTLEIEEAP